MVGAQTPLAAKIVILNEVKDLSRLAARQRDASLRSA
jgi:hypothetical protein